MQTLFHFVITGVIICLGIKLQAQYILVPSSNFDLKDFKTHLAQEGIQESYRMVYAGKKENRKLKFISLPTTISGHFIEQLSFYGHIQYDSWGEIATVCDSTSLNDPGFYLQWGLFNDGSRNNSVAGSDISACEAWGIERGDSNIIVGFVDSGTKLNHNDLNGRYWINQQEIPNNGQDDDNNGYVDDVQGWNVWQDNNDVGDHIGHGTQVAGIVGANAKNASGFVGIDWRCKLMTVKGVNNSGQGLSSWWAEGVYYLVDNGADIINLSLSATNYVPALDSAIQYAERNNVLIVAATGNQNGPVSYPAKYQNAFAVGATDHADNRALWSGVGSNFGPEIDVVAPGKAIYGLNHINDGLTYVTAGTSQAAPLVSGLASLIMAHNPFLDINDIKSIIRTTADDEVGRATEDSTGYDRYHGFGRVNAFEALTKANQILVDDEETILNHNGLKIFPNPANNHVVLGFDHVLNEKLQIMILDIHGRTLKRILLLKGQKQLNLDVSSIKDGIYFIQCSTTHKNLTKKLVINRSVDSLH